MPFPSPILLITVLKPDERMLHASGGLGQEKKKKDLRTTHVEKLAENLDFPST